MSLDKLIVNLDVRLYNVIFQVIGLMRNDKIL